MSDTRLIDAPLLQPGEIAAVAVELARATAAIHERDEVHGHIRPSRVVLRDGAAVLQPGDGTGFSKAHDVRSIGELTLWLLSRNGLDPTGPLADIAREAASVDPASRPTAHELLARLEALRVDPEPEADPDPARNGIFRWAGVVLGVVALAMIAALGAFATGGVRSTAPDVAPKKLDQAAKAPRAVAQLPDQVWPQPGNACVAIASELRGDLDGDGCPEILSLEGGLLVSAGGRVSLDIDPSTAVTGDWTCAGGPTLAVLDRVTGTVFHFPRWASQLTPVSAETIVVVPGAVSLLSRDSNGDGCDELLALTKAGSEVAAPIRKAQP